MAGYTHSIVDVICAAGLGAFFYDDQAAVAAGPPSDGFLYRGAPITPGFSRIRLPAECLSIGLCLGDGSIAWGDMMSVQYSGADGRDPLFTAAAAARLVDDRLRDRLIGLDVADFAAACRHALQSDAAPYPAAAQYGVSQALLRAAAHASRSTMAETICRTFGLPVVARRVPLYAQSGDARETNIDKMILKGADILPHGLINSRSKFGPGGDRFLEFVAWVSQRVRALGHADYHPVLHFDVYGWIGREANGDLEAIASFIKRAAEHAAPFELQIESPADFGTREAQLARYARLVEDLDRSGCGARIVVDEWCNTIADVCDFIDAKATHMIQIKAPDVGSVMDIANAVLLCKRHGIGGYLGGSCTETDLSAAVSVHVAVATQADMLLAKPGMGVDEALSITGNEQNRLLATLARTGA